jgi:DNA-3-methyladenine glycosylase I
VINERVVVGYGKTMPANTPLSETISNVVRKRGFQFVGPVIVYAWMQAVGIVNDHETHCFRRNVTPKRR